MPEAVALLAHEWATARRAAEWAADQFVGVELQRAAVAGYMAAVAAAEEGGGFELVCGCKGVKRVTEPCQRHREEAGDGRG